jgi:hypothetical protein
VSYEEEDTLGRSTYVHTYIHVYVYTHIRTYGKRPFGPNFDKFTHNTYVYTYIHRTKFFFLINSHTIHTCIHTYISSSVDMYSNEVGPMYSPSKRKKCYVSFMCIYSPLDRLLYCTCIDVPHAPHVREPRRRCLTYLAACGVGLGASPCSCLGERLGFRI